MSSKRHEHSRYYYEASSLAGMASQHSEPGYGIELQKKNMDVILRYKACESIVSDELIGLSLLRSSLYQVDKRLTGMA
jgi:hypothetical protein